MANYVTNGDFSSGVLSPWSCVSAWCQVEDTFLQVRERKEVWAGPRQNIPAQLFTADEDLKVGFNFSVRSGAAITTEWKMKITKSGETNYYLLYTGTAGNQGWEDIQTFVTLPHFLLGCDTVELYLEVTPGEAELDLDNITMEKVEEGNWKEEADKRIEILRKRNMKINYRIDETNPEDLEFEIVQKTHQFPFGTAVISSRIADCYDAEEDNAYCSFVRDNFNWMVDSYR